MEKARIKLFLGGNFRYSTSGEENKMGRCSKYSNYLPLPSLLIGIVNFPNRNFDNFDLRPPGFTHC